MAGNGLMQRAAPPAGAPPSSGMKLGPDGKPIYDDYDKGPPQPEEQMEKLMRQTGYKGSDPAEGMAHVWKMMPTDDVAELIDMLSAKHGLPTPFPKQQEGGKPMKLGGPKGPPIDPAQEMGAGDSLSRTREPMHTFSPDEAAPDVEYDPDAEQDPIQREDRRPFIKPYNRDNRTAAIPDQPSHQPYAEQRAPYRRGESSRNALMRRAR